MTEADAQIYGRLATSVIYANAARRAAPSIIARNQLGQSGLWRFGISGDLPIVLVRIGDVNRIDLVKQALQAHAYWRIKGLAADLVILNEDFSGYRAVLQDQIMGLINAGPEAQVIDKPGGVFVRRAEELSEEDRVLFQTVARVVLTDTVETLAEQVQRRVSAERLPAPLEPSRTAASETGRAAAGARKHLPQRPGRLHRRRPRVRHHPRTRPEHAGALGERHRQPAHRHGRQREGQRLHLGGERPRVPPDHLPQRPGQRQQRRGVLHPRRGDGRLLVADAVARPRPVRVRVPARLRLQRVRALRSRHLLGDVHLRRHGRTGEVRGGEAAQPFGRVPATVAHRVLGAGARRVATRQSHAHRDREGSRQRGALRPQPVLPRIARPGRLRAGERSRDGPSPGTAPSSSDATARWPTRRPCAATRLSGRTGAGLDPCAAIQTEIELADGQEREIVFVFGAADDADEARRLVAALRRPGRRAAGTGSGVGTLEPRPGRGVRRDSRPRARRARQRLAGLPDPLLPALGPQRLLPVGRRLRLPRPIAGHDGSAPRDPVAHPRASAALRRAPVPRGRRAALVASARRARRAHPLVRRLSLAAVRDLPVRAGDRRYGRARRAGVLPRRPGIESRGRGLLRSAAAFDRDRQSLRTLRRARSSTACASAGMDCR